MYFRSLRSLCVYSGLQLLRNQPRAIKSSSGQIHRQRYAPIRNDLRRQPLCTQAALTDDRTAAQSLASTSSSKLSENGGEPGNWEIKMLYDGGCPLCMREVNMLKRRDEGVGKIAFVDIDSPDYDAAKNAGISYEQAMSTIHGILPDGKVVTNVEVFRRLYEAVGLGWVYAITKMGPVGRIADWVYAIWAKYRLPITGRPDLEVVLQEKKTCK